MINSFSKLSIISVCIFSINSIATNIIALFNVMMANKIVEQYDFDMIFTPEFEEFPKTQMQKQIEKNIIKIAVMGNAAYWIDNSNIYKAIIDENGEIDRENALVIDVFKLSEKEVDKLASIIDVINS